MPATPKPDDLSPSILAADWQRMKSEMTPKPDTSPANVARVLRDCAADIPDDSLYALADALDQQAAPTWEERVRRAAIGGNVRYYEPCECDPNEPDFPCAYCTRNADAALRAAFPELVPSDD